MNNKKALLISIAVLIGIIFYLLQGQNTRENITAPSTAELERDSVLEKANTLLPDSAHSGHATGVPTPEPGIREALAEMLDTSSDGLEQEEDANGAVSINLKGRFRMVPVATIDEAGEIHIEEYAVLPGKDSP